MIFSLEIVQSFNWERFTLEEFYPALAIANLMHILGDQGLVEKHKDVVEAVLQIFKNLKSKSFQYVEQVVPKFIPVIRQCDDKQLVLKDVCYCCFSKRYTVESDRRAPLPFYI